MSKQSMIRFSRVYTAGRRFFEQFGGCPPPLGGDYLGEDYGLFGRAVAIHFFSEKS